MSGFVEEVGFGFGGGGGEVGGVAKEGEEISEKNLQAFKHFLVSFWEKRSDLFSQNENDIICVTSTFLSPDLPNNDTRGLGRSASGSRGGRRGSRGGGSSGCRNRRRRGGREGACST